jgi:hypothetical protein
MYGFPTVAGLPFRRAGGAPGPDEVSNVTTRSRARMGALLCAMVVAAGCGGEVDATGFPDPADTDGVADSGDDAAEAAEPSTMPDVIGLPVDDAVAELESLGFNVSTGVVRTTEVEPDLVYRSEPHPGQRVREGQRVTLRISAEPRD